MQSDKLVSTPKGHTSSSKAFCFVLYQPYTDHSTTLTIPTHPFFTEKGLIWLCLVMAVYMPSGWGCTHIQARLCTCIWSPEDSLTCVPSQGLLCLLSKSFSLTQDSFDWASLASQQTLGILSGIFSPRDYKRLGTTPIFLHREWRVNSGSILIQQALYSLSAFGCFVWLNQDFQ